MPELSRDEQHQVIIALLAVERHLLNGGRDAVETQRDYTALRNAYRGPSQELLDRFPSVCSGSEEGTWMAALRTALERELDPSVWREVLEREQVDRSTEEPQSTTSL